MKVLLLNANYSSNMGSAAQIASTVELLKTKIPDAHFCLLSYYPKKDSVFANKIGLNIVGYDTQKAKNTLGVLRIYLYYLLKSIIFSIIYSLYNLFSGKNTFFLHEQIFDEFLKSDLVIDLSGDSFADSKGGWSPINCLTMFNAIILKKSLILYSQSIGPFKLYTRSLAKFCLNHSNAIIVRENISYKYLKKLGIHAPIFETADCAFLLRSDENIIREKENINIKSDGTCYIGVSVNSYEDDKNQKYVTEMSNFLNYIIKKYHANIIFIPHSFPNVEGNTNGDDRVTGRKIYNKIIYKNCAYFIDNIYGPCELKGIIKECDLFIGCRMHACIAALSNCIPTITIGWCHKYYGIMHKLGQEQYVLDYKKLSRSELESKFDLFWKDKDKIKEELRKAALIQKKLAKSNGTIVLELLRGIT